MKEKLLKFKESGLFLMIVMLLCSFLGVVDAGAMTADIVNPEGGGAVRTNSETSLGQAKTDSPNLTLDDIDKMVTKIRPVLNPLDTILRYCDTITVNNPVYRHYAIDVIDGSSKLKTAYAGGGSQTPIEAENNDIFSPDETIIVEGIPGYEEDGTTATPEEPLMLYIVGKDTNDNPIVRPVNGQAGDLIPAIPAGTVLLRMGKAGSESQISTSPYSGVPTDWNQFCQKFMAETRETEMFKRADKEVDWTFTDQAEEAIYDMKTLMNRTFWRGVKRKKTWKNHKTDKAEDIYFTKGVWTQAWKEFDFAGIAPDNTNIPSFMRMALTGNASTKQKIFIAGSGVIEAFEKADYLTRNVNEGDAKQGYGLEFSEIRSKFGRLLVVHDESFDQMGFADQGFVLDPNYLRKGTYGIRQNDFDLRKAGIADMDARSIIEQCFAVLKNPKSHTRVYLNK